MDEIVDSARGKWADRLAAARTPEDVIAVCDDFLWAWRPAEIGALPHRCRPGAIASPDDVSLYAFQLVQAQLSMPPGSDEGLDRMAAFFSEASHRMAELFAERANVSRMASMGLNA